VLGLITSGRPRGEVQWLVLCGVDRDWVPTTPTRCYICGIGIRVSTLVLQGGFRNYWAWLRSGMFMQHRQAFRGPSIAGSSSDISTCTLYPSFFLPHVSSTPTTSSAPRTLRRRSSMGCLTCRIILLVMAFHEPRPAAVPGTVGRCYQLSNPHCVDIARCI
jgi:hypothetical protein